MHTCNLLHCVEDFQFFWIEGWYAIIIITLNRKGETTIKAYSANARYNPHKMKQILCVIKKEKLESFLPFDPSDQEVQTALDLGAVYEAVNVKSIDRLSGWTSCAMAG